MLDTLEINERQLELLLDPNVLAILRTFKTIKGPSDAARELNTSASRLHYHVNKLTAAGLLIDNGRRGKSTLYQTAARTFFVPGKHIPELADGIPGMLDTMLDRVKHGLSERFGDKLEPVHEMPYSEERKHFFTIEGIDEFRFKQAYPEVLRFDTLFLTPEQYKKLTATLMATLNEFDEQSNETATRTKACSVNLICFQGNPKLA